MTEASTKIGTSFREGMGVVNAMPHKLGYRVPTPSVGGTRTSSAETGEATICKLTNKREFGMRADDRWKVISTMNYCDR